MKIEFIKKSSIFDFLSLLFIFCHIIFFTHISLMNISMPFTYMPDELHDLNGMIRLIQVNSFQSFYNTAIRNPLSGYHGFISLSLPALIGYIPYKIYGLPGLLFTARLLSVTLISSSFLIYGKTFIKTNWIRSLFVAAMLLMPGTNFASYFPRVEAYLFFFTALFFYFFIKSNFRGNWCFIFLGFALASRISITSFLPFLLLFIISIHFKEKKKIYNQSSKRLLYFLVGYAFAEPFTIIPKNLIKFINNKYFQVYQDTVVDPSIGPNYYLKDILPQYLYAENMIYFLVLFSTILAIYGIYRFIKKSEKSSLLYALIIFSGVFSTFLIIYTLKMSYSYWYFQHHIMFILLGSIGLVEIKNTNLLKLVASVFLVFLISLRIPYFPTHTTMTDSHKDLLKRYDSPNFHEKIRKNYLMKDIILKLNLKLKRDVTYKIDSRLFPIHYSDNSTKFIAAPYTFYPSNPETQYDIYFHSKEGYGFYPTPDPNTQQYEDKLKTHKHFKEIVHKDFGGNCSSSDCYYAIRIFGNLYAFSKDEIHNELKNMGFPRNN